MSLTALAFVAVFGVGLALALALRPIYGLYVYVFVFYAHPPSRWWGLDLPSLRWSLLAAIVTLLAVFVHRNALVSNRGWYQSTIGWALLVYVIWMWVQWPWVISPTHLEGAVLFSKYLVLFYLIHKLVRSEEDFLTFCLVHVMGCMYLGWLIWIAPDTGRLESVGGPGIGNSNTLAMHLGTGLIFASFILLADRGWRRWCMVAAIPLILNGIIQTETRGALVGLGVAGIVTTYLKPKKYRTVFYVLSAIAIVGFIGIANDAYIERIKTLKSTVDTSQEWDASSRIRVDLAYAQLKMFADYPFGAGHQGTAALSRKYLDERHLAADSGDRASHNTALSILVDQGFPGFFLFLVITMSALISLKILKTLDSRGLPDRLGLCRTMLGGSLASILGAGMFAQYIKAEILYWNLALLVVLLTLGKQSSQPKPPVPTISQRLDKNLATNRMG